MSWTLDQLTALESAIAEGALRVKYADKEVEYRSLDDMMKIRDRMKAELTPSTSTAGPHYVATSKGT